MALEQIEIRRFRPEDQVAARELILQGLVERWGELDETKNPDLAEIARYYETGDFLVAVAGDRLVATGALLPEEPGVGRIARMSVARAWRRRGLGGRMLRALLAQARARGYRQLVLETTSTWADAVAFYQAHGFVPVAERDGDTHFELVLAEGPPQELP